MIGYFVTKIMGVPYADGTLAGLRCMLITAIHPDAFGESFVTNAIGIWELWMRTHQYLTELGSTENEAEP